MRCNHLKAISSRIGLKARATLKVRAGFNAILAIVSKIRALLCLTLSSEFLEVDCAGESWWLAAKTENSKAASSPAMDVLAYEADAAPRPVDEKLVPSSRSLSPRVAPSSCRNLVIPEAMLKGLHSSFDSSSSSVSSAWSSSPCSCLCAANRASYLTFAAIKSLSLRKYALKNSQLRQSGAKSYGGRTGAHIACSCSSSG